MKYHVDVALRPVYPDGRLACEPLGYHVVEPEAPDEGEYLTIILVRIGLVVQKYLALDGAEEAVDEIGEMEFVSSGKIVPWSILLREATFQPVGHLFPEPEGSGGRDYVESNNVGDPELLGNIVNGKIAHSVTI